jgi:hypothetical protein
MKGSVSARNESLRPGWIRFSAVEVAAGDQRDDQRQKRPEDALAQLFQMLQERHPRQLFLLGGRKTGLCGSGLHQRDRESGPDAAWLLIFRGV